MGAYTPPWADTPDGGIEGVPRESGTESDPRVYFIGIIDILTGWSIPKRIEHMVKALTNPSNMSGVSCVPPPTYAKRFERAMKKWV